MPVRASTGRNAVVRDVLTWPLQSVWHAAAAALLAAGIVVGVAFAFSSNSNSAGNRPPAQPAATASPSTPASREVSATPSSDTAPRSTASASSSAPSPTRTRSAPAGDPARAAERFAAAWVRRDAEPDRWRARLRPLCTDEFGAVVLPTITPGAVAASTVTGHARITASTGRGADAAVGLDTMRLDLHLQDVTGDGDWRVSDARPAR